MAGPQGASSAWSGTDEARAALLARSVLGVVDDATQGSITAKVRDFPPPGIRVLMPAGHSG